LSCMKMRITTKQQEKPDYGYDDIKPKKEKRNKNVIIN